MPPRKPTGPEFLHLSEILEGLDYIPPARILLRPPPGTATEKDVLRAEGRYNRLCELFDGTLVEKPMGFYESNLAMALAYFLHAYLIEHDLGFVSGESGMVRVDPFQIRMPDVAFYSWRHFPGRAVPAGSILDVVPDLAVEILSPTNTKREMERKRREYFLGGCALVWEVDPPSKTVRVYTAPDESKLVRERGTLDGEPVLPGFKVGVREWFARAGKRTGERGTA